MISTRLNHEEVQMRVCEANVRVRNVMTKASLRPDVRQKSKKTNKQKR